MRNCWLPVLLWTFRIPDYVRYLVLPDMEMF
jgi:hypothetical protein